MRVVVCAKQVIDPDGVNSYALWGRLEVDDTGRAFRAQLPLIANAYDEQAIEAALRLRDDGHDIAIAALTAGGADADQLLRHCKAMGCDEIVRVDDPDAAPDACRTGRLLAAAIRELGGADLVLCGRQSSDGDQGVTPAFLAEELGYAYVTLASDVRAEGERLRVRRATPLGEEVVLASMPAVVTVSNELGVPRYPTGRGMIAARRHPPRVIAAASLGAASLGAGGGAGAELVALSVHEVAGECEFVEGADAAEQAAALLRRLEAEGVL